ncbi:MAG: type II toxin-antitoxin system HicB family antitoxin [Gemmataceae bacterium]
MRYAVVLEKGKTNFSAYVPDLPGCVATGRTKKETLREIEEAIAFHLDGMKREGLPIPKASTQTEYVDVA